MGPAAPSRHSQKPVSLHRSCTEPIWLQLHSGRTRARRAVRATCGSLLLGPHPAQPRFPPSRVSALPGHAPHTVRVSPPLDGGWELPEVSRSQGMTDFAPWQPLPRALYAVWPGPAASPLWAASVTDVGTDPSERDTNRGEEPHHRGRGASVPGGAVGVGWGCSHSPHLQLSGVGGREPQRPPPPLLLPSWFPGASALREQANVLTLGVLEAQCWARGWRQTEAGGGWGGHL